MPERIHNHARGHAAALVVAAALVTALAGCSEATTPQGPGAGVPRVAASVYESAEAAADPVGDEAGDAEAGGEAAGYTTPGPEKVRDAFAGLRATLYDTCTPGAGDCAYFLGRVNDELTGTEASMKADPQGPGHFKEPLEWTAKLRTTLAGDTSTASLEEHFEDLVGTRDRVNSWMRGHPEDYR
ncbi:hypothetical protein [Streptomyces sp. NPDC094144]|uniref:hypothetical protein n=1 Tax=Streptomyces sp. NPDC094144 TaxID=3366056 RepID=UPI0037F56723